MVFEDPVVESFYLFVGITDHKFLLEVFEEILFGLWEDYQNASLRRKGGNGLRRLRVDPRKQ
jgi:hypothetical protein